MPDATVNGATIHYETTGEGPPLVLLHGIGSNSRSWRRQLESLARDFKVIAWDAPGYGKSSDPFGPPSVDFYADMLRGVLDEIGLSRIFLLGHSTGGGMAQEFYKRHPSYVRALILADTRYVGSKTNLDDRLRAIRTMTPTQLAAERAPKLLSPLAPQSLVEEVESIMSEVRRPGYEFAAISFAEFDGRDIIGNLDVPTLLIWGDRDEITPLWDKVPQGGRLEIIPNAGHLCYVEQPERFNEIVREFLSENHSC